MSASAYAVLGVDEHADTDVLRRAYRRRACELHPDVNPDDPAATRRFQDLVEAYDMLSDPARRAVYDASRAAGAVAPVPAPAKAAAPARRTWPGRATPTASTTTLAPIVVWLRGPRAWATRTVTLPARAVPGRTSGAWWSLQPADAELTTYVLEVAPRTDGRATFRDILRFDAGGRSVAVPVRVTVLDAADGSGIPR